MLRSSYALTLRLAAMGLGIVSCYAEVSAQEERAPQDAPAVAENIATVEEQILRTLDQKVSLTFYETPLSEVAQQLRELTKANVLIDRRALEEIALADDLPLSGEFHEISLRSVLNLLLRGADLTWAVADDALIITTPEEAEMRLITRVYNVADLVAASHDDLEHDDLNSLISVVTSTVQPETWDDVGGYASIEAYRGTLIISQTESSHQQIAALFNALRKAKDLTHASEVPKQVSVGLTKVDANLVAALQKPVSFDFEDTPLSDVAMLVQDRLGAPVVIDSGALEDSGISSDAPVSLTVQNMPAGQALRHALRPLDLAWILADEVLLITTSEEAELRLEVRIYPVGDLSDRRQTLSRWSGEWLSGCSADLTQAISLSVEPHTWSSVGGAGAIVELPSEGVLVVLQTAEMHERIETVLTRLRKHLQKAPQVAEEADPDALTLVVYLIPVTRPAAAKTSAANPLETPGSEILQQFGAQPVAGLGGIGDFSFYTPIPGDDLVEIVTELVEPESWNREGAYLKAVPGRLIVRHTVATHHKIEKLLKQLGLISDLGMTYGCVLLSSGS